MAGVGVVGGAQWRLEEGKGWSGGVRRQESLYRFKNSSKVIVMSTYGLCADYKTLGKI